MIVISDGPLELCAAVEGGSALAARNLGDVEAVGEPDLEVLVHSVAPCVFEKPFLVHLDARLDSRAIIHLVLAGPVEDDRLAEGALELSVNVHHEAVVVDALRAALVLAAEGQVSVQMVVGRVSGGPLVVEGQVEGQISELLRYDVVGKVPSEEVVLILDVSALREGLVLVEVVPGEGESQPELKRTDLCGGELDRLHRGNLRGSGDEVGGVLETQLLAVAVLALGSVGKVVGEAAGADGELGIHLVAVAGGLEGALVVGDVVDSDSVLLDLGCALNLKGLGELGLVGRSGHELDVQRETVVVALAQLVDVREEIRVVAHIYI